MTKSDTVKRIQKLTRAADAAEDPRKREQLRNRARDLARSVAAADYRVKAAPLRRSIMGDY